MASTILSDNGVSSGSAGLKTTADSSGVLELQTTTSGGTATTAVTINTSQNMGLGVTPSAWGSGFKALDVNTYGAVASSSSAMRLFANSYNDGTGWVYKTTAAASRYDLSGGAHAWQIAASGTAGNAISFTQAMTLDSSGQLGIGVTSPTSALYVAAQSDTAGGAGITLGNTTTNRRWLTRFGTNSDLGYYLDFYDGSTWNTRLALTYTGNLLVGTTSSSGSGASSGKVVVQFNGATGNGIYYDDTRTSAGSDTPAIFARGTTVVGRLDTTLTSLVLTNLSDQRVKTNIADSGSALDVVGAVQVRQFDWTIDDSHEDFGFVAQELNEVLPQAVSIGKTEEEMWGVNFVKLVPILTKAIQEQQALIASQSELITQLQADVAALKGTQP